jgi:hypothetical protein
VVPGALMLVNELIDATSATWDWQNWMFGLWHHERSGNFSVRFAYLMLVINKERATAYLESIAGMLQLIWRA